MAGLSRRDWMMGAAAAGALSFDAALGAPRREKKHGSGHPHRHEHWEKAGTAPDSLNGVAHGRGLAFGSCLGTAARAVAAVTPPANKPVAAKPGVIKPGVTKPVVASLDDPQMRALFVSQCGILVPENELKMYTVRPSAKAFDFARADLLMTFASQHQLAVRGHTLLWNRSRWMPEWINAFDFGTNPATAAEKFLRDHITTVCKRYGDRIFSYDVVNETIAPATGDYEESPFTKILGPAVIDICFHAAREAAPHAELVYNDYMGWTAGEATHRTGVLKLLDYIKKKNLPVDTLGIQAHIGSDGLGTAMGLDANQADWRKFLDDATAMGFNLAITEFDINDQAIPGTVAERDRAVADLAKAFLDTTLSYSQLRYVMAWGLVDKYSWLQKTGARADGQPKRCAPYDDEFQPKQLRAAIAQALAAAPVRPAMAMNPA